jgi:hypothetical protein
MINVAELDRDLIRAGILYNGCNSDGVVWGLDNSEIQTRPDVAVIVAAQPQTDTPSDMPVLERRLASKGNAFAIPSWATWDQSEAQTWWSTNIDDVITSGIANLPATLTLATTRTVILQILNVLSKMSTMLWALARMIIALRDNTWPDLPEI